MIIGTVGAPHFQLASEVMLAYVGTVAGLALMALELVCLEQLGVIAHALADPPRGKDGKKCPLILF